MTDCNKTVKDIEYAKDLLQNRPEQDTVDYKVYEVLDDALDLIHDLRNQIAMLVAAQHELCELLKEQEKLINVDELREKLGFSDNCENCKQNSRHCQYDSHFSLMDFCERLDMAIEELMQKGR